MLARMYHDNGVGRDASTYPAIVLGKGIRDPSLQLFEGILRGESAIQPMVIGKKEAIHGPM
jgi:hypothetical protein